MRVTKKFQDGILVEWTINGISQPIPAVIHPHKASPSRSINSSLFRPGDILAITIRKITGASPCPQTCRERIRTMNAWGWWKSWRNREQIATWLAQAARDRGHQITDKIALDLLKSAFKELRDRRRLPVAGKPTAGPLQSP
jgi:hypothetical protein